MKDELKTATKLFFPTVTDEQLKSVEESGNFVGTRINEILRHIENINDKRLAAAVFASCFNALLQNFSTEDKKNYLKYFITKLDRIEKDGIDFEELVKRLKEEKQL